MPPDPDARIVFTGANQQEHARAEDNLRAELQRSGLQLPEHPIRAQELQMARNITLIEEVAAKEFAGKTFTMEELLEQRKIGKSMDRKQAHMAIYNAARTKPDVWIRYDDGTYEYKDPNAKNGGGMGVRGTPPTTTAPAPAFARDVDPSTGKRPSVAAIEQAQRQRSAPLNGTAVEAPERSMYETFGMDVGGHHILRREDGALFVAVPIAEHVC